MNIASGDLVVRFGKILKVHSVESDYITLKPYFKTVQSQGLLYTIMKKNLNTGQIRTLTNKAELASIWKSIFQAPAPLVQPEGTAKLDAVFSQLKYLWTEKQKNKGVLPGARLSLYQQTLCQASDEVAAVKNMVPETAKTLILKTLSQNRPAADGTI